MNRLICFGLGTIAMLQFNFMKFQNESGKANLVSTVEMDFDSIIKDTSRCFLISGSFLIPQNADNQLKNLKNRGFKKAYTYNFPQTEYYSVVVDTFNSEDTLHKILIDELLRSKQNYFIKCL